MKAEIPNKARAAESLPVSPLCPSSLKVGIMRGRDSLRIQGVADYTSGTGSISYRSLPARHNSTKLSYKSPFPYREGVKEMTRIEK
jgi:hypothetical protein